MHIRPYQKLIAWQEAHKLCRWIYSKTEKFPARENFRLVSQMCGSSSSVPTNIAEGNMKSSRKEKAHFFEIALCSVEELHYQCLLSKELQYITEKEFDEADDMIQRTSYLITKLRSAFL